MVRAEQGNDLHSDQRVQVSGLANNDGWLSSPQGQQQAENETRTQSYVDLYNAKVDNPYRYSIPRLVRLGLKMNF